MIDAWLMHEMENGRVVRWYTLAQACAKFGDEQALRLCPAAGRLWLPPVPYKMKTYT